MTEAYKDNTKVFGRWQPRMLEPFEAAQSLMQLLGRTNEELAERFFQVNVTAADDKVAVTWSEVKIAIAQQAVGWSDKSPLLFP